jgi:glutaredoxin 3
MGDRIIIYGKAGWPYTDKAREAFESHDYFDVKQNSQKMDEMLKFSNGKRKVPVIVEGPKVTVGFAGGSWGVWIRPGGSKEDESLKLKDES